MSDVFDCRHVFDYYDENNVLRDDFQKVFVKHLVKILCMESNSPYPTSAKKIEYAKLCVVIFPSYKSGSDCGEVITSNYVLLIEDT